MRVLLVLALMGGLMSACADSKAPHQNGKVGGYKSRGLAEVDWKVAQSAFDTASDMKVGRSDKIMKALFAAALVESECNNLNHGDDDSLGFLQQRPSQGWGTAKQVRDVPHATRAFVNKARKVSNEHSRLSVGDLAQEVQRSGYGGRYALREADAVALIGKLK